ncbi:MAG: YvcK family protein, partial [Anaerolineae bacterium]|nr:YvcK family protein [Anaerolineae bacterium]
MGGGTGLSTLLRGLKVHSDNITAIVSVADDGGSSGRLRQATGMPPPGDIRQCLVALSEAENLTGHLFQYRFSDEYGLAGHN